MWVATNDSNSEAQIFAIYFGIQAQLKYKIHFMYTWIVLVGLVGLVKLVSFPEYG